VWNTFISEALSIHWHGLYQRGNYYMDGTSYITQCPIGPRLKFTYRFIAEPAGTHWYHSHQPSQRTDGLYGSFNNNNLFASASLATLIITSRVCPWVILFSSIRTWGYGLTSQYSVNTRILNKILYNISLTIKILFIYFIFHYIFLRFEI